MLSFLTLVLTALGTYAFVILNIQVKKIGALCMH
jgi:hypothetical protein